ncbi:hypothetical protein A2U01_0076057, partial [Trifolium medium]|nr:hypothetical protein [Trifolium medium]
PKVTAIEEAKYIKKMSLETLISNLRSHEIVLNVDKSQKKTESMALQSKTSSKALKAKLINVEEESSPDDQEEDPEDEDFALFTRNFHKWTKLNK